MPVLGLARRVRRRRRDADRRENRPRGRDRRMALRASGERRRARWLAARGCLAIAARWRPCLPAALHPTTRPSCSIPIRRPRCMPRRMPAEPGAYSRRGQEVRGSRPRPSLCARGAPRHRHGRPMPTTRPASIQEAIASAQRYTTLHPGTKDAALAHHIIASAHFDEIKDPQRDQTATRKALAELKMLRAALSRQPLRQAGREPHPLRRGRAGGVRDERRPLLSEGNNQVAAINRFKTVVAEYQTTAHVEEAL